MLSAMRKPWALLPRVDWLLTPDTLLQLLILWPLELYEAVAILPVSFLRRHVPAVGGALVVLMTLHGILLRLFLELLRARHVLARPGVDLPQLLASHAGPLRLPGATARGLAACAPALRRYHPTSHQ
jgi:hypothetical protein